MTILQLISLLASASIALAIVLGIVLGNRPAVKRRRAAIQSKQRAAALQARTTAPSLIDNVFGLIEIGFGTVLLVSALAAIAWSRPGTIETLPTSMILALVGIGLIAWGTKKFGQSKKSGARAFVERDDVDVKIQIPDLDDTDVSSDTPAIVASAGRTERVPEKAPSQVVATFTMRCLACGGGLKIPAQKSGQTVKCPRCGKTFVATPR